mgnify:CR=1 FL=1
MRIARVIENIWKYLHRNSKKVAVVKNHASPKSAMKTNGPRLDIQFTDNTPKGLLSQAKALNKHTNRAAYKITSNVSEPCNAKEFAEFQKDLENSKTIFKAFLLKDENLNKNKETSILSLFSKAIDKNHNTIPLDEDCMKNLAALTPNEGPYNNPFDFGMNLEDLLPAVGLKKFESAEPFNRMKIFCLIFSLTTKLVKSKGDVPEIKLNFACVIEEDGCN